MYLKLCMSFIVLIVYTLQWLLIYRLLSHWLMISLMLCAEITRYAQLPNCESSQRHQGSPTRTANFTKVTRITKTTKIHKDLRGTQWELQNYKNCENSQRYRKSLTRSQRGTKRTANFTKITRIMKIRKDLRGTQRELRKSQKLWKFAKVPRKPYKNSEGLSENWENCKYYDY